MPRFFSPEWVAAFNDAVAEVALPAPVDDATLAARDGSFTVAQGVRGDLGVLVAGQAVLAALAPHLADLHTSTTY